MTFTEEEIYNIYKLCYQTSTSKGKIKQHTLNQTVENSIMRENEDNVTFEKESKINCNWGKHFKVDVLKYKNDLLKEIILIKAPASSIGKNHVNSLNNLAGEFQRIKASFYEGVKIRQINFIPNVSPILKNKGVIKDFEKNKSFFITENGILCYLDIQQTNVTFNINGIENCETKMDIHNLFINNNPISNIVIETSNYISNV